MVALIRFERRKLKRRPIDFSRPLQFMEANCSRFSLSPRIRSLFLLPAHSPLSTCSMQSYSRNQLLRIVRQFHKQQVIGLSQYRATRCKDTSVWLFPIGRHLPIYFQCGTE